MCPRFGLTMGVRLKTVQHRDAFAASAHSTGAHPRFQSDLDTGRNLPAGTAGGAVAALIGATCWALVAVKTGMQMSWVAVLIGFLVGYAMRFAGRGDEAIFGVAAGGLAIIGCLLGNLLTVIYFIAQASNESYFQSLRTLNLTEIATFVSTSFRNTDLIFYAISLYIAGTIAYRNKRSTASATN